MTQESDASPDTRSGNAQILSAADRNSVIQAVVDEIYDHHLQGYVADVGKHVSDSQYQVGVYFKPTLNSDGAGWVIYKLMPYGEVLRMFTLRSDGLAVLHGKLGGRFPPTQPSYLTVYMDDAELCQFKKQWSKEFFAVNINPSAERVGEARARQLKRKTQ